MRYNFDKDKMEENEQKPLAIQMIIKFVAADGIKQEIVNLGFEFQSHDHKTRRLGEALMQIAEQHLEDLINGTHKELIVVGLCHVHDYELELRSAGQSVYRCKDKLCNDLRYISPERDR